MSIRRLLMVLPLVLALGACLDPIGPRIPDDEEGDDDPPPTTGLIVDLSGSNQ